MKIFIAKILISISIVMCLSACHDQVFPNTSVDELDKPTITAALTSTEKPSKTPTHLPTDTQKPSSTPNPSPTPSPSSSLTPTPTNTKSPVSSTDSVDELKPIVFYSGRDGNPNIFIMNGDGSDQRNLTTHPASDQNPVWSPDGKTIAFLSTRNQNYDEPCALPYKGCIIEIFTINPDGTGLFQVTKDMGLHPVWSPDSQQLAFVHSTHGETDDWPLKQEVYLVNKDGSNLRALTTASEGEYHQFPQWSPKGDQILFRFGKIDRFLVWGKLGLVDVDSGEIYYLPLEFEKYDFHAWSPDGNSILIWAVREFDKSSSKYPPRGEAYVVDVNSWETLKIKTGSKVQLDNVSWSPDGRWIAYTCFCDETRVEIIDTSSWKISFSYALPGDGMVIDLSWASNSKHLITSYYVDIDREYTEIYLIDTDNPELVQLTDNSSHDYEPSMQP